MSTKKLDGVPVGRLVGPFHVLSATDSPFPEQDRLVLVEPELGDPFLAKLAIVGNTMLWPYWISETIYRKSHPMDKWCYYERPNTLLDGPQRPISEDNTWKFPQ